MADIFFSHSKIIDLKSSILELGLFIENTLRGFNSVMKKVNGSFELNHILLELFLGQTKFLALG